MPLQRLVIRALTRILSAMPVERRSKILLKLFRHSAAHSLDIIFADKNARGFSANYKIFLDELRAIFKRLSESGLPEREVPEAASILKTLLEMDNLLYRTISFNACEYDKGLHPKHRLTKYHDFFCKNVGPMESVLDLGCGNGFLTRDIAECTSGRVVGIDMNAENIEFARNHYQTDNVEFICGNVETDMSESHFDVIVLSNVLEHLSDRMEFLKNVLEKTKPKTFLIRVPMYEREWMAPMKQELGVDYMLDAGHEIEYTQEGLFKELGGAGLRPKHWEIRWGEIWCVAVPENDD